MLSSQSNFFNKEAVIQSWLKRIQEETKKHGDYLISIGLEDRAAYFKVKPYVYQEVDGPVDVSRFEQGMEIPIYYDPMIAKLIVYGKDRTEAIERMIRAIDEYAITGITTTLAFGKFVMQHPAFTTGQFDTHFVKKYFTPEVLQTEDPKEAFIAALMMEQLLSKKQTITTTEAPQTQSDWVTKRRSY